MAMEFGEKYVIIIRDVLVEAIFCGMFRRPSNHRVFYVFETIPTNYGEQAMIYFKEEALFLKPDKPSPKIDMTQGRN